jgi:DNA polymerase gamma 1
MLPRGFHLLVALRKNEVDVQMLHPDLHSLVFPKRKSPLVMDSTDPTPNMVRCAISHLEKQNLWGKEAILVPDTTFPVPKLRGQTIEDHFYNIGVHDVAPYREIAVQFAQSSTIAPPKQWLMQAGWTRYGKDGSVTKVTYPQEKALAFDVETVPGLSKYRQRPGTAGSRLG